MNISGLFSYQDSLNQLLAKMGKALVINFGCSIDTYDGVVAVDYLQFDVPVDSTGKIMQELRDRGVDSDLIAEIITELEYAEIDIKARGDFPANRWDILDIIDDDNYRVTCRFLLTIEDM